MYFVLPTLLVILFSFLIVRAASIALMMTGLDEKRARFQALSAFSGTGFTTKEAESVVNHPLRRRIVTWLMIMGNAGIVTVIVAGTSSVTTSHGYNLGITFLVLIAGGYLIYRTISHSGITRRWERFIENRLQKWRAFEEDAMAEDLLHLGEGYGLVRVIITPESPLLGRSLAEVEIPENELWFLGVERGREWIPFPKAQEEIAEKDRIVVYGHVETINHLFKPVTV